MKTLDVLLSAIDSPVDGAERIPVYGLTLDSRTVRPGEIFVAVAGTSTHGMTYVETAIEQGASAVLYDDWDQAVPNRLPCIRITNLRERLPAIVRAFYDDPFASMRVIGVTGTNGKTTTVQLIAQLVEALSMVAGRIGTLGVSVGVDKLSESDRTTPDAITLGSFFSQLKARGASITAMEVSSHALDQGRVQGVPFEVGVFTNLTRDHLDYHGTMEAYGEAKARLFREYPLHTAVIYLDDALGRHLAETITTPDIWTYGFADDARIRVIEVTPTASGCNVACDFEGRLLSLQIPLLGQFNALNAVAALAATAAVCPNQLEHLIRATSALKPAPGRMEWFQVESQPTVVVDFAHTPDALENALTTCRWHTEGALWVVFGCGGERDTGKRPLMGEVAGRLADHLILTADNPRSEDAQAICDGIIAGTAHRPIHVELDRGQAIRHALEHAEPRDWILVAGKGHERTQQIGSRMLPYSDRLQVAQLLGLVEQGGVDAS